MKTNKFLDEKAKEKGITAKEFAVKVGISEDYAKKLLSPNSQKLPSDEVGKRIVKVLELSNADEEEFWKILAEDRRDLQGEPAPAPQPAPSPCPELPELEEMKKDIRRIGLTLDEDEKWIHTVEEMLWRYKEEDRAWGAGIEEKLREIGNELRELRKLQGASVNRLWRWIVIALAGLGILSAAGIVMLIANMGLN